MASVPIVVPALLTERLVLRQLRVGDFEDYAAHMADPLATKHMSSIDDRRAAWRSFCALSGAWLLRGAGWWAIEVKATAQMVGLVGAFSREAPLELGRPDDIELGWSVFRRHWRNGYATEAAREALRFAFEHHRAPRAIAHIDATNAASIRVSRAIGMNFVADVSFYGHPSTLHAIDRPAA